MPNEDPNFFNLDDVQPEQKKIYNYWLSEILKGNIIDIGDNLSYVFTYINFLIFDFIENEDINFLLDRLEIIIEGYSKFPLVNNYLISCKADAYCI